MISLENIATNIIAPFLEKGTTLKVGKFDPEKEQVVMLKDHQHQMSHDTLQCSAKIYDVKHLRLTVHWNLDYSETEKAANELYTKIKNVNNKKIDDDINILFITMDDKQSIENPRREDIFERFIDFVVYYN